MAASNTEKVVWYYDSSAQPYVEGPSEPSSPPQWKEYDRSEIDIIEKAYQAKSEPVCLDQYRIELKKFTQVRIDDDSKRRAVRRESGSNVKSGIPSNRLTDTQAVAVYSKELQLLVLPIPGVLFSRRGFAHPWVNG